MKEKPILFSTDMVKAILEGRKTVTRRIIKPQPLETGDWQRQPTWYWKGGKPLLRASYGADYVHTQEDAVKRAMLKVCPYGQVGDRLWVRETHYRYGHWILTGELTKTGKPEYIFISHSSEVRHWDNPPEKICRGRNQVGWFKRPSIFMPRWASRINLEITGVRVERLQEITWQDCKAEGITLETDLFPTVNPESKYLDRFKRLWDFLNAKRGYGWSANPWVWVIEFKRN